MQPECPGEALVLDTQMVSSGSHFFLLPLPQSWLYLSVALSAHCKYPLPPSPPLSRASGLQNPQFSQRRKTLIGPLPPRVIPEGTHPCVRRNRALTSQGCPAPEREALEQDTRALCSLHRQGQCP